MSRRVASAEPSYALGAVTGDFDLDGDVDLYVANDSRANYLFENRGGGHFREAALEFGVDRNEDGRDEAGMGVDSGDLDNDGRLELVVTNFSHETNTLYRSDTPGVFEDATDASGLGLSSVPFTGFGTVLADFDGEFFLVLVTDEKIPHLGLID